MVTVEDHWPQGGIGEAVLSVFADGSVPVRVHVLAVREMPVSATPQEQLADAGIDAAAIADAARALAGEREMVGAGVAGDGAEARQRERR
jgi:transketolase